MSLSKTEFHRQQEHEAGAIERAAQKQAEIAADLSRLLAAGCGATTDDLRRLAAQQADVAGEIETARRRAANEEGSF